MPGTEFDTQIEVKDPLEASGVIETKYGEVAEMFVGILTLGFDPKTGDPAITAAAYGRGQPIIDTTKGDKGQEGWSLYLQPDTDPDKTRLKPGDMAKGFVVVQLRGGGFTGWIDDKVELVAPKAIGGAASANP